MIFADRLKELRKEKELTQEELARLMKISPSTVGMYEQGRREPDNKTLLWLADFFDVSVDYLLGRISIKTTTQFQGNKLKSVREAKGMSLEELARKIDIDEQILTDIELGRIKISPSIINKIGHIFSVDEVYFYTKGTNLINFNIEKNTQDTDYAVATEKAEKYGIPPEELVEFVDFINKRRK